MTGICYFADDLNEYFAELQVNAISNNIDDSVLLLREDTDFSISKLSNMLETAMDNNCDKLVILTEDDKYNILSQIVPKVYNDMFENIEIVPEAFKRIRENDMAAAPQANANVQPVANPQPVNNQNMTAQKQNTTQQQNSQPVKPAQPQNTTLSYGKTFILCDALHLTINALNSWNKDYSSIVSRAKQAGIGTNDIVCSFVGLDSIHIMSSMVDSLFERFPKHVGPVSNYRELLKGNAPDFSLEVDMHATLNAFKDLADKSNNNNNNNSNSNNNNSNNNSNNANTTKNGVINIFAPKKVYDYLTNAVNKETDPELKSLFKIYKLNDSENTYENKNNEEIYNYFTELLNVSNELKKSPTKSDKEWNEVLKAGQTGKDYQNIEYIQAVLRCMVAWGKIDHRRVYNKLEKESELAKVIKDQLKQLSGYNNLKKDWEGSLFGYALDAAEKIAKAVEDDSKKDNDKSMFDEKSSGMRNNKNIFLWENYDKLCALLSIK